jgi:hypothetical protein
MNIGEKSERFLKAFLLKRRDENITDTVFGKITELSDDTDLSQLSWTKNADSFLSSYDVPNLVKILGIGKAQTGSKADISVNRIKYSLKEINGSPPAIVNHTPRPGFENVCDRIGVSITKLDKIISDYWSLRQQGIIKEDTKTSDQNCPFRLHKKYLKPIIEYFIFTGTGQKDSNHPADKVLEINYKSLPTQMEIYEKDDYYDQVWDKLVFSIRSKGMNPKYPNCKNQISISKWTENANGKFKGALHIRVK